MNKIKLLTPFLGLVATTGIAGSITSCGCSQQKVNVTVPEYTGLSFSNKEAFIGKDYDTDILIDTDLTDNVLPKTLTKITSGNHVVTKDEYTYTTEDPYESAHLHIPGEYVVGDIIIDFELVEPIPEVTYTATPFPSPTLMSCTIELSGSTFHVGDTVTATISPATSSQCPNNETALFICTDTACNNPLDFTDLSYDKSNAKFSFKMPAQNIYVGAMCYHMAVNIITHCSHETCPGSISATLGQTVNITFSSADSGYHIATSKEEFLASHRLIGDYNPSSIDYTYSGSTGTLSIQGIMSSFYIIGSAPSDS